MSEVEVANPFEIKEEDLVVIKKIRSPKMLVLKIYEDNETIKCGWFDAMDHYQIQNFSKYRLHKCPNGS